MQRVFGGLREFVGDWSLMKGEEYNHRGLPYIKALEYHSGESSLLAERATRGAEGEEEEHHHAQPAPQGLFSKIYASVKVTADSHLNPSEEKEVLPWFYIAVRFNPHSISGYVLGSYWLERAGKVEEGLKFLREGERNNPLSPQIAGAIGDLYYRQSKIDAAIEYLEKAHALWKKVDLRDFIPDPYLESDRFFCVDLLAHIYEKDKEYSKAIDAYKELNTFRPYLSFAGKIKSLNEQQAVSH